MATLDRQAFRAALDAYRKDRPPGDKEHRRATDVAAGSLSPQKLYGTPVGLMFFEGAQRLRRAAVTIPGLQQGDPARVVVEAYPGMLARFLIGKQTYKQDSKKKQTAAHHEARIAILRNLGSRSCRTRYGLDVDAPIALADDATGDRLDALLRAIQAAWAWTRRRDRYGAPPSMDPLEGWIADPALRDVDSDVL